MDLHQLQNLQAAVAEQRAAINVDPVTARRLVVQGRPPLTQYITSGTRWLFRGLGLLCAGGLAAGAALLVTGRPVYAALVFLAALILHYLWGALAAELVRMIALRDAAFCGLAVRDGWITLVEPPVGPGRALKPLGTASPGGAPYEEEIAHAKARLAERPDDAQTRFDLGVTYLLTGKFDLALEESRILTMTDARLAAKLQALTKLLAS
ncbi:MAG: hypothetical protein ACOYXU_10410 [Nitrospirota bacterium]